MNMKVDWAAVAIQTLHHLLVGQEIGFTVEDVDALLSKYAGKALDFPYSLKEKRSGDYIPVNTCGLCPSYLNDTGSQPGGQMMVCRLQSASKRVLLSFGNLKRE